MQINKADIEFAVKAYLKEVGQAAKYEDEIVWVNLAKGMMGDFLEFVEEL